MPRQWLSTASWAWPQPGQGLEGSASLSSYLFQFFRLQCQLTALELSPPCVVSVCSVGVWEVFCSVLLDLLGSPHEIRVHLSGSPVITASTICSTATTCTIQTWLCTFLLSTEDLLGTLWHVNLPIFFLLARDRFEAGTFSMRGRCSSNWALPPQIVFMFRVQSLAIASIYQRLLASKCAGCH